MILGNLMMFVMGAMRFEADGGDGGGGDSPAWMAQLPDNLKTNEILAKNPNLGDLSTNYLDLHGKMDGAIHRPGEGASAEDMSAFHNELGRPETMDGYELKVPEGKAKDEAFDKFYREAAHKHGISKAQAEAMFGDLASRATAELNAEDKKIVEEMKAGMKEMMTEWGEEAKTRTEKAHRAFELIGGKDLAAEVEELGLGNDPKWLKLFDKIANAIDDDGIFKAMGGGKDSRNIDPATGRAELEFPSMDK